MTLGQRRPDDLIEGWYNPVRLHSALGYQSPMAYEAAMESDTAEP